MANLSITSKCNLDCTYCFARSAFGAGGHPVDMPVRRFEEMLDLLADSGQEQVRVLGGEPTLHPQFPVMVERAISRGFRLLVFSNGLIPEPALQSLERLPRAQVSVMINAAAVSDRNSRQGQLQTGALRRLGSHASLSFTIQHPDAPQESLLELIEEYGLDRTVCLGLAHSCRGAENRSLAPKFYPRVGERVAAFAIQARAAGVVLDFDCGFVPCMFSSEERKALGRAVAEIGTRCNPIPDILPGGEAVACYPLASLHRVPCAGFSRTNGIRDELREFLKPYRELGIFKACAACDWARAGKCSRGCIADAMTRMRQSDASFSIEARIPAHKKANGARCTLRENGDPEPAQPEKIGSEEHAKWVIPYIDQPIEFWNTVEKEFKDKIKEVYFPLPGNLIGSGRPPQPAAHLDEFLLRSPLGRSVLINPMVLPAPVEEVAPKIIDQIRSLASRCEITAFTVSNLDLAVRIRAAFPDCSITASVLMDIAHPGQILMLNRAVDSLVPSGRIMRDLPALRKLRSAFTGRIRLIVNESCIPGCPFRVQHFHEMANLQVPPRSLCDAMLDQTPWLRLTGSWVLPQHLRFYRGLYDELKLAGRATLRDPADYLKVLRAYTRAEPLSPHEIGGGPASVLKPMIISGEFFLKTLYCSKQCDQCSICRDYYGQ